jgi:glycerol-3-phosphate dehydrogenase (NAD(P)+)
LLAARLRDAGVDAPVLRSLTGLLEGRVEPERFASSLTAPRKKNKATAAA